MTKLNRPKSGGVFTLCSYFAAVLLCAELLIYSEEAWSQNECRTTRNSHWASWRFFGVEDIAEKKWIVTCNKESYTGITYTEPDSDGNRFPVSGPGVVYHVFDALPSRSYWDDVNHRFSYLLETGGGIGPGDTRYDNFLGSGGGSLPPGASTGSRI